MELDYRGPETSTTSLSRRLVALLALIVSAVALALLGYAAIRLGPERQPALRERLAWASLILALAGGILGVVARRLFLGKLAIGLAVAVVVWLLLIAAM